MRQDFSPEAKKELREWAQGKRGHHRRTCPECSPHRVNKRALCLSATINADHMLMSCHHCYRAGATKLSIDELQRPYTPPPPPAPKGKSKAVKRLDVGLTEEAIKFLATRAISLKTAQVTALVAGRGYFPDLRREDEAVAYPYLVGGKKSHKFRALSEKAHICDEPLVSLFMLQMVDFSESEDMIICEGELDSVSYYEAGVVNSTSVPNGSSSFTRQNEDGSPREVMGFLWEAKDIIDKAKRILISSDNDEPGDKLAEELARRIGKHRCWRVKYPDGCKDANDVLVKFGKEAVQHCIETAEPWPLAGLYEADHYFADFDNLYDNGFGHCVSTGIPGIDPFFKVAPGMLTIVTGNPNAGKSNWVNQVMINLARSEGYVSAICSFETQPTVHLAQLSEMLVQKHFFVDEDTPGERMDKKEMEVVKPFLNRHFKFIHQEDGEKSTIESIIERIKTAVFRWGVKIVVIDPFSYIQRPKDMESETSFIGDLLARVRLTAKAYGVHVFFVAHPAKPQVNADGTTSVPTGYSISGSAHWFNHADHGITVHRQPDTSEVEIRIWKTRFSPWFGKNGSTTIYYDPMRHCYFSEGWSEFFPYEGDDK